LIEIDDNAPDVSVPAPEYIRLLGYPAGWTLEGRARELAGWAREWYGRNGHPWVYARQADSLDVAAAAMTIDGVTFSSARVRRTLDAAGASGVVVAAVSAGPELEEEAQARWREGKPDEYFFLEVYGSAVVEHLVTMIGARLCAWADGRGLAVLPHYSPGYPEWAIEEQPALLDLIRRRRGQGIAVDVLESGMLKPKKSLLAVFGLTGETDRVRRLTELSPCENCSFAGCQYRRLPYRRAPQASDPELAAAASGRATGALRPDSTPRYSISVKALQRWAAERLSMDVRSDGSIAATFRYEGTTCTNTGRPLHFHYHVTLGPRHENYPVRGQTCRPSADDQGYTSMCGYLREGEQLMAAIAADRPLDGRPLAEVLEWTRTASPAGCYCEAESRLHKWGLVLETLHYALTNGAANPEHAMKTKQERS
jgi:hypothetical protein